MLTCKIGEKIVNCFDGTYDKKTFKKWSDKNILICPVCGKPYEYCHGKVMSPYFRHKEKDQCEERYSEPETEEHIRGKKALYEWVKTLNGVSDVVLEGWIPDTHQRPDIMFKYNSKQYVIEFQCTPIASEYIERHELYQVAGIVDIWILGTCNYMNNINQKTDQNRRLKTIEKYSKVYFDSFHNVILFADYYPQINFPYYTDYNDALLFFSNYGISKIYEKFIFLIGKLENILIDNNNIIINSEFLNEFDNVYSNIISNNKLYIENIIQIISDKYKIKIKLYLLVLSFEEYHLRLCSDNLYIDSLNLQYSFIDYGWRIDNKLSANIENDISMLIDSKLQRIKYLELFNALHNKLNKVFNLYNIYISFHEGKSSVYNYMFSTDQYKFYIKDDHMKFNLNDQSLDLNKNNIDEIYEFMESQLNIVYKSQIKEIIDRQNRITQSINPYLNSEIILINATRDKIQYGFKFKYLKFFVSNDEYMENHFISELNFLKRLNVNKYVFMIPKYNYFHSNLGFSRYLRINDLNDAILKYFKSYGFKNVKYYTEDIVID